MKVLPADLLYEMKRYAEIHHVPIIGESGSQLLSKTVKDHFPQRVLEIGTAIGYSTLLIAQNMAAGGKILTIELDPERAEVAEQFIANSGFQDTIEIIVGNAGEVLPRLQEPFDFVFIDAAKGQYLDYLKKVESKLTDNGLVIADNILFRGYVMQELPTPRRYKTIVKRLREYIQYITHSSNFTTKIYSIGDGMTISYYKGGNYDKT